MRLRLAGEPRWIATEDAGLLRDALGAVPPSGLPEAFLADVPDALARLARRYARTHGPFESAELRARYGIELTPMLESLECEGELVRGELRPGGSRREWCDPEVLRRLRRASLAVLRREIEPAERRALARFAPEWQGVDRRSPSGAGVDRLREVLVPLQGLPLAPEVWERDVLPRRVGAYSPAWLDQLCASGEVVWVGAGPVGRRGGKVALYFRDDVALLGPPPVPEAVAVAGDVHERIRERLRRAPCFFTDFLVEFGGVTTLELQDALWDLVWSGEVTNDAFAPLRSAKLAPPSVPERPRSLHAAQRRRRFGARPTGRHAAGPGALVADGGPVRRRACGAGRRAGEPGPNCCSSATASSRASSCAPRASPAASPPSTRPSPPWRRSGVARRGYFVEGLGGAQFALPAAVERLRGQRDDERAALVLAATDPAQVYGAALRWPQLSDRSPGRHSGAYVVQVGGDPVLFVDRGGRGLQTLVDADDVRVDQALQALVESVAQGRVRRLAVERIDGEPAVASPHAERLIALGFRSGPRRLTLAADHALTVAPGQSRPTPSS